MILNLMSMKGIEGVRVASILGYCLLPLILLSLLSIVIDLRSQSPSTPLSSHFTPLPIDVFLPPHFVEG